MNAKAPEPESGLRKTIGSASAGMAMREVSGLAAQTKASSAPLARSIAMPTKIAAMYGMMRTAT